MTLTADEDVLLRFLLTHCPSTDSSGAVRIGVDWGSGPTAGKAHTQSLREAYGGDWQRFAAAAAGLEGKGAIGVRRNKAAWPCWPTAAARALVPTGERAEPVTNPPSSLWEKIIAAVAALVVLGLIVFLVVSGKAVRDPLAQFGVRILLSFAVAYLTAAVPGFLFVELQSRYSLIKAGGALAVFVLTFAFTPKLFPPPPESPPPAISLGDAVEPGNRTIARGRDVAVSLLNAPAKADVVWALPARGRLSALSGPEVRYTAERAGEETLRATVTSPGEPSFVATVAFRVLASLESVPRDPGPADPGPLPGGAGAAIGFRGGVRNPLGQPVRVRAVALRVSRFEEDHTPRPQVEMFPFLDYLIVRPRDRGWGPARPSNLQLLADPPADSREYGPQQYSAAQSAALLNITPAPLTLSEPGWNAHHFIRLGPAAKAFSYAMDAPAPPESDWAPRRFDDKPVAVSRARLATVFVSTRAGPAEGDSGAVRGRLKTGGSDRVFRYKGRRLQATPVAEPGAWLARLVHAPGLTGQVADSFVLATGDLTMVSMYQTMSETSVYYGAEIHLRAGGRTEVEVPLSAELGPGAELTVDLTARVDRSVAVQGTVVLKYRVADGEDMDYEIGTLQGSAVVPRPEETGWEVTQSVLADLRKHQPDIRDSAARLLEAARRGQLDTSTAAARSQLAARTRDALMVLLTQADAEAVRPAITAFLASPNGQNCLHECFPLLCAHFPDAAVSAAVGLVGKPGAAHLLATCLCFPATAALLPQHKAQLGSFLKAAQGDAGPYPSTAPDDHTSSLRLALALMAGLPHESGFPDPQRTSADQWAVAAWTLAFQNNPPLETSVRAWLRDTSRRPHDLALVLGALAATGNRRFEDEVAGIVRQSASEPGRHAALMAGLGYFCRFPTPVGLRPLLTKLESYPYDAAVRAQARHLLN